MRHPLVQASLTPPALILDLWALPGHLQEGWITNPLVQASLIPSNINFGHCGPFLAVSGKGGLAFTRPGEP